MTVSSEINKSGPYTGNGVTTVFAYGFRILDASHIEVIRTADGVDATVSPSAYSVSGVGSDSGNVVFSTAPAVGQSITIIRNVPFTQSTDLENQGAYYAETIEAALDLSAMRDQQLAEELGRAVKVPVGASGGFDPEDVVEKILFLGDLYLGAKSSAPSVDNDGDPLKVGAVYWDTGSSQMFTWSGSEWRATFLTGNAVRSLVVATDGQTAVAVPTYLVGGNTISVFLNGLKVMVAADYVETDQNTITFTSPLTLGDEVEVIVVQQYAVGTVGPDGVTTPYGITLDRWIELSGGDAAGLAADTTIAVTSANVGRVIEIGGISYRFAPLAASDADLTTAGLVKFYETGSRYTTRERFAKAIARGDLGGLADGTAVLAGGQVYLARSGATEHPNLPGFLAFSDQMGALSGNFADPNITKSTRLPMIRLQNGAVGGGASTTRIQGVDYDPIARQWFTIHSLGGSPEQTVISLLNTDGSRISVSDTITTLGHGQDIGVFYRADMSRWLVSQTTNRLNATFFQYLAGAGPQNAFVATLFTDSTYTTININRDKTRLIALGAPSDVFKVRFWDLASITASGDYSSSYIHEVEIEQAPFTVATNPVQSVTADDKLIYIVSGNAQTTEPKFLSAYDIATGRLIIRSEITARRDFAIAQNSGAGTEYEPEGMTWWSSGSGEKVLVCGFSMDQPTTSSGAYNYAILLRPGRWAALIINGDDSPTDIGALFEGGAGDIGWIEGAVLNFVSVDNTLPAPVVTERGRVTTKVFTWLSAIAATGFQTWTETLADDKAATIPVPPGGSGSALMLIVCNVNGVRHASGILKIRTGISAACIPLIMQDAAGALAAPTDVTLTTGTILAGTTGTDNKTTISVHSNGNVYIENRSGQGVTYTVMFVSAG